MSELGSISNRFNGIPLFLFGEKQSYDISTQRTTLLIGVILPMINCETPTESSCSYLPKLTL